MRVEFRKQYSRIRNLRNRLGYFPLLSASYPGDTPSSKAYYIARQCLMNRYDYEQSRHFSEVIQAWKTQSMMYEAIKRRYQMIYKFFQDNPHERNIMRLP